MAAPTAEEQLLLEYLNAARLNPLGDAAHYIAGFGATATSANADVNQALNFYKVSGPAFLQALTALTPVNPVAWSDQLSNAAQGHNTAIIASDTQTHQAPGELDFGARLTAAGYRFTTGGENVYAYATSPLDAHAGFMVDWGPNPDGMQSPPGHRVNIMGAGFREVGVAITHETSSATSVGPEVVTEDFGSQSTSGTIILGVAYADTDGDDFYSIGEGRGGLTASVGGAVATDYATGGYTLATSLTGPQTITFSGANLAAPVTVVANLVSGANVKLDLVNGTELKTSVGAAVSGPITLIEGLGTKGLALSFTGGGAHTIQGGAGNDAIVGGSGTNYLRGADGDDLITGGSGFDDINGNKGADTIDGGLAGGADWLVGGQGNDLITAHLGDGLLYGNLGNDTLNGGGGNEIVRGGQGDDVLFGGAGNDFLSGDLGNDTLTGGSGADIFHSFSGAGIDRITDFNRAEGDYLLLDHGTTFATAQVGADTVVTLGPAGDQVTLVGVSLSSLSGGWVVVA
jgi:Ca2+-binding RTX toxin-like protein